MPHETPLIATIVGGLCLAFLFGAAAQRLKVSPLVGYLLAGIAVGPHTPGFVADQSLANELAEIGVILLMFGVGLHFSLSDLMSVRAIALPGALVQILVATLLGLGLAHLLGWSLAAGLVFGLALSVASTVVLLRALQERRLVSTERGRITVGWLIVEDIAMVFALVLLPVLVPLLAPASQTGAGSVADIALATLFTIGKVVAFCTLMIVVGGRVVPLVLHAVAHSGSRELFRLAVFAIALGCAFGAAKLFGVSFALGAFFAGMILSSSELSQRAAEETLPLRDAFAVLFFVSVGMLFDPSILVREFWPVMATVAIIVVGKSIAAFAIVRAFGHPTITALTISVSLAQIGEFSFILASLGVALKVLPAEGRDLILAGALLSILFNPLLFLALDRFATLQVDQTAPAAEEPQAEPTRQTNHVVLVGYGRVGGLLGRTLSQQGVRLFVVDPKEKQIEAARTDGHEAVAGSAADTLPLANLAAARAVLIAIPDSFEAGQAVTLSRQANPDLPVIVTAYSDADQAYLQSCGATLVVLGTEEIADAMAKLYERAVGGDRQPPKSAAAG